MGSSSAHFDPATPRNYILETIGSGLGWIDYDNDGWPDLFFVQDGPDPPRRKGPAPTNKLYRNNGDGTFTDVTEAVGLARAGYGMGCAVGDFDNDGFDDLVVTYFGGFVLYHNEPDPTASPAAALRGRDREGRAGQPALGDELRLGRHRRRRPLDLYVCNYVEVDLDNYPDCDRGVEPVAHHVPAHSCSRQRAHRLFRNNGNGTFTDVTASSG